MNKKQNIWLGVGVLAAVGSIAAYLFWKSQNIEVEVLEEEIEKELKAKVPKKVVKFSRKSAKSTRKVTRAKQGKVSKSVQKKLRKSEQMLKKLKSGQSYTQIEIQELAKIPYRSVRRYVDELIAQGKLKSSGYGKGKRFTNAS